MEHTFKIEKELKITTENIVDGITSDGRKVLLL